MIDTLKQFRNSKFDLRLAYLVDLLEYFSLPNLYLQNWDNTKLGSCANIFMFEGKLHAFMCKSRPWIGKIETTLFGVFDAQYFSVADKITPTPQRNSTNCFIHNLDEFKKGFTRHFLESKKILKR
jgi:hypothetical protein